jgi:hypothetical protein
MKSIHQKSMLGASLLAAVALAGVVFAGSQVSDNSARYVDAAATEKVMFFTQAKNKVTAENEIEVKTELKIGGTTSGVSVYMSHDSEYTQETVTLDSTANFVAVTAFQSGSSYKAGLRFKAFAQDIQEAGASWTVVKSATDSTVVTPTSTIAEVRHTSDGTPSANSFPENGVDITAADAKFTSSGTCNGVEFSFVITASESFVLSIAYLGVYWSC